jgi:hypothetical protein
MNEIFQHRLAPPVWRNSRTVCALADEERHFGHVEQIGGRWHAFDATHLNAESNGFRTLGSFTSLREAKESLARSAKAVQTARAGTA